MTTSCFKVTILSKNFRRVRVKIDSRKPRPFEFGIPGSTFYKLEGEREESEARCEACSSLAKSEFLLFIGQTVKHDG